MITSKAISGLYQFMISHLIEDHHLDIAALKMQKQNTHDCLYSPHALKTIEAACNQMTIVCDMCTINYPLTG